MEPEIKVYFTLHKGRLVKSKINMALINTFGIKHVKEFDDEKKFKKFVKLGYIKTPNKTYKVSKYDINDLMVFFRGKYEIKKKKVRREKKNGKPVSVIDWDYTVNMS